MPNIAICLSGCGVFDGSEIHESVLTMLALDKAGASYQCFAPDRAQTKVVNHLTQQDDPNDSRNCLQEAARIARGKIKPLSELKVDEFDGALFPGGFGAAINLCNFAEAGKTHAIQDDVLAFAQAFANANKPLGFICIAPVLVPRIFSDNVQLTIGHDANVADALVAMGCSHNNANVDEVVIDEQHKVVTTPAYMLGQSIAEVAQGIERCVAAVLKLAE